MELSLVKPGERLFIVKGIDAWRRRNVRPRWTIASSSPASSAGRRAPCAGSPSRCPWGRPAVTRAGPFDERGEPFPTTDYLTCPHLVAALARIEAAGGVERWTRALRRRGARRGAGGGQTTTSVAPRASSPRPRRPGPRPRGRRLGGRRQPQVPARPRGVRARPAGLPARERILAELDPLWPEDGCCTPYDGRRGGGGDRDRAAAVAVGGARLEGLRRDPRVYHRLLEQVDTLTAELRRRSARPSR